MIIIFSDDINCDKSTKCADILSSISQSYKFQLGITNTTDVDMLEKRLPTESVFVYLPLESPHMSYSEIASIRA